MRHMVSYGTYVHMIISLWLNLQSITIGKMELVVHPTNRPTIVLKDLHKKTRGCLRAGIQSSAGQAARAELVDQLRLLQILQYHQQDQQAAREELVEKHEHNHHYWQHNHHPLEKRSEIYSRDHHHHYHHHHHHHHRAHL